MVVTQPSASELLRARWLEHEPQRILPIARKTNTRLAGFEAWTRARDIEAVMDALPALVELVEAAEAVVHMEATSSYRSLPEAPVQFKNLVQPALARLREALNAE